MKHHQAYVNGVNAAKNAYFKAPSTHDQIALQPALKFNGGGQAPCRFGVTIFIVATGRTNQTLFGRTSHL